MLKIKVDMQRCQHYGQCALEAPDVFRLNSENKLEWAATTDEDQRDRVESAIDVCPMQAITLDE